MKPYTVACSIILAVIIFGPLSLDPGLSHVTVNPLLRVTEANAEAGKPVVKQDTRKKSSPRTPAQVDGASIGSRMTPEDVRQLLALHNRARGQVGSGALTWSGKLATYAQEWADHLASRGCKMEHRPVSGKWKQEHGENLLMATVGHYGVADAVMAWESEKTNYRGEPINMSNLSHYGHYTQLVWRNTKHLGCARVECGRTFIVVCNYDPPGNVLGQTPY